MSCFHPLHAYRSLTRRTPNGKSLISFNRVDVSDSPWEEITLPCGQCLGCRIDRTKSWALRCLHESALFQNNCFITLTFNDANLDPVGTLLRSDFQRFMKRLRKAHTGCESVPQENNPSISTYPIRFYHCGEYGTKMSRPHHHALLFNFDFDDKKIWQTKKGVKLYTSKKLEKIWPFGYSTIGDVTFQSAAYVARYIQKKVNGALAPGHYMKPNTCTGEMEPIEPEYTTMSRRPGIGKRWFQKYHSDVFPKDFITNMGTKFKSPAYYDAIYDSVEPEKMAKIKHKRKLAAIADKSNNTPRHLKAKAAVAEQMSKNISRGYENDSENVFDL